MSDKLLTLAVEGDADAVVAERLAEFAGLTPGPVHGRKGKSWLDQHLEAYNHAAKNCDWFVLRDLDRDADCAPELVARVLPVQSPKMHFRVAVHAVEAWLMADRTRICDFLRVAEHRVPANPDEMESPQLLLVNIARNSRLRAIRDDMVPAAGMSTQVGPAYTARLIEFARLHWQPDSAARRSPSLSKCITTLRRIDTN